LFFPFYLIVIAVSLIVASRYSSRILQWTYSRSLPVLATLFLLFYTSALGAVLTVLFSYSTVTQLPSGHQQLVWSIDASVPLFGLKFTILFITCLVLFLLLIVFNINLLFSKYLPQLTIINHVIHAFHGSYKDECYSWVAAHFIFKSMSFVLYACSTKMRLIVLTMLLIGFSITSASVCPYKSFGVYIQDLLYYY